MTPQAIASRLSEVAANNNASDKQFAANLGRFVNEFLYYGAEGDGPRAELYDGSARADLLATMQDMIDYDAYGFTGASDDDMWLAVCLYVQEHMVSAVDRVADFNDYVDELVSERAASDDAAPARSYAHPLALFDAVPAEGDTVEVPSKSIFTDPFQSSPSPKEGCYVSALCIPPSIFLKRRFCSSYFSWSLPVIGFSSASSGIPATSFSARSA